MSYEGIFLKDGVEFCSSVLDILQGFFQEFRGEGRQHSYRI